MEQIMYRKTLDVHKNGVQFMLQGFETADNLSRVIEISLMASGDAIDFPLERMVAMMYVTTPGATEPSINECTIKDNKVVYEVLPIVEEGITTMQLKLIETSPEGSTSVLASPKFSVEVTKSDADDGSAEQSTTFTALEDAVAKAAATYDARLLRVEIDEVCIFRAYYADGTVYETDELRKTLLQGATNLDLNTLIKDGIANFTADEVAAVLDEKYKQLFSNARYVSNLLEDFAEATFVKWDADTENTPYKAGLTECTEGFAHVFGSVADNHTIVAWTMGGENLNYFTHNICSGKDNGWDNLLSKIDCLKTEIAKELRSINDRISEESRLADERISKVETDGFHIGDIRYSCRDNLGDKYLLCNGEYVCSLDDEEYSGLIDLMHKAGYTKTFTLSDSVSNTKEYIVIDDIICVFYTIENTPESTGTGLNSYYYTTLFLRKFNSKDDYLKNIYTDYKICVYKQALGAPTLHVCAKIFQNKVCLLLGAYRSSSSALTGLPDTYCYTISINDIKNGNCGDSYWSSTTLLPSNWSTNIHYSMVCVNNKLIIILCPQSSSLAVCFYVTSDGTNFNKSENYSVQSAGKDDDDLVGLWTSISNSILSVLCYNQNTSNYWIFKYNLDNNTVITPTSPVSNNHTITSLQQEAKILYENSDKENDDIKMLSTTTIEPKSFTVSVTPTISPDVGYAYIKAKE